MIFSALESLHEPATLPALLMLTSQQEVPTWELAVTMELESALMGKRQPLQMCRRWSEGLQVETEKGEVFQAEGGIGQILKVSKIESLVCPLEEGSHRGWVVATSDPVS